MLSSIRYKNNSRLAQLLCLVVLGFCAVLGMDNESECRSELEASIDDNIKYDQMYRSRLRSPNSPHRTRGQSEEKENLVPALLDEESGLPVPAPESVQSQLAKISRRLNDYDKLFKMFANKLSRLPSKFLAGPQTLGATAALPQRLHGEPVTYKHNQTLDQLTAEYNSDDNKATPLVYDPKRREVHVELMSKFHKWLIALCYRGDIPKARRTIKMMSEAKGRFADAKNPDETLKEIKNFIRSYEIDTRDIPLKKHETYFLRVRDNEISLPLTLIADEEDFKYIPSNNWETSIVRFDTDTRYYLAEYQRNGKDHFYPQAPKFFRCHITKDKSGNLKDWYLKGHVKGKLQELFQVRTSPSVKLGDAKQFHIILSERGNPNGMKWHVKLKPTDHYGHNYAEIELTTKRGDRLLYKIAPKEVTVNADCGENVTVDMTKKYSLAEEENVRVNSMLRKQPEFLRCHFYGEDWFFTGEYDGECSDSGFGRCNSKKRDYATGNCLECEQPRKAKPGEWSLLTGRLTGPNGMIRLKTGDCNALESWRVHYRQGPVGKPAYIQLICLDTPDRESLEYKIDETQVDLERRCIEFKTFNDFFSRSMAEDRRPNINGKFNFETEVDRSTGRTPLISCADSRVMVFETIDDATKFWVKEQEFNLGTLLGKDSNVMINCAECNSNGRKSGEKSKIDKHKDYLNRHRKRHQETPCRYCRNWDGQISYTSHIKDYTRGLLAPVGDAKVGKPSMVIFRLAPQDYHRFHYAVSGTVLDHYSVNGLLYSVNPAAINGDDYKVFQENQRYVTVIQTDNDKLVYAIPVGAAMVGSIVFENDDGTSTVKKGDRIHAGTLHGKMRFGGSTVVYLFEDGAVDYDEDLARRCTGNWTEKIPCPSVLCEYKEIWEEHQNDTAELKRALDSETPLRPCGDCDETGCVEGKTWPMMESYYQAGERLGTTTIQCARAGQ